MGIPRDPLIAADRETLPSIPLPSALVSLQRSPLGSSGGGGESGHLGQGGILSRQVRGGPSDSSASLSWS